jgi:hypothetical protein
VRCERRDARWAELVAAAVVAVASGCADFALPSALSREQVVAVRASPAAVPAGERAMLEALVAGPDGVVDDVALTVSLAAPAAGCAIDIDDAGAAWLVVEAGAEASEIQLAMTAATPAGATLDAIKRVTVGAAARRNPEVVALEADSEAIDGALSVTRGSEIALAAVLDDPAADRVSWFTSAGDIESYRDNPTTLVAADEPRSGVLIAVGRDDLGGVGWRVVTLVVE